ncbi:MAG TPA: transketolase [Anaerolineaceae bacterium]
MQKSVELTNRSINAIRFLSADAVQKANSGHPGLPMGMAAVAYSIWTRHMLHNPANPEWPDRDRFVLSGGHGSMLLYSLLYLTGYNLSLDELRNFRQWGSLTPGHPEYGLTPGVETTTGPLGQGFATGVGMAIAEASLAAHYNRPGHEIVDHYVYAIVTDGDLMEGVASEAASLAGHLKLGKLIYFYDDNRISIEGSTELAFTEDRGKRFEAYQWHVQNVDGLDLDAVDKAVEAAKADPRPSLIICRTTIGYGLPNRAGTAKAHGEPAGEEEIAGARLALGWDYQPFEVPEDVLEHFRAVRERGEKLEAQWRKRFEAYRKAFQAEAAEMERRLKGELPADWEKLLPSFPADPKGMATRASSGKVINAIAGALPELMGGSADLAPSTNTLVDGGGNFQPGQYDGRNLHFGVREHGMGAVVNGMAAHKGFIPYGATFLVFSDYMRPAVRISALSHFHSIWIFTHDSIGLGEDGPTHQPVEHLAALRAIPQLVTLRPADANEVSAAWKVAIKRQGPTALALTRQAVPTIDRSIYAPASGLEKGAYVLADLGAIRPQIVLMASGSEVALILEAGSRLAAEGVGVRVVSFPSWELFEEQDMAYQNSVLLPAVTARIAVEAGVSQGWWRWVGQYGRVIGVNKFGASAPAKIVFQKYGFTVENILAQANQMIGRLDE